MELEIQDLIWFGAASGAAFFGGSLLWTRFVRKEAHAVRSGGGYTLFAVFMLLFAVGAFVAGVASSGPGR